MPRLSRPGALVLLVAALLLAAGSRTPDLRRPDEPRYARVAQEIHAWTSGWKGTVLLHLNGEPYAQKPPLYFWLAAAAGVPFGGVTPVAARLPSVLAALGTLALLLRLARGFGPRGGGAMPWIGAGLLATVPQFMLLGMSARLDALLTCFVTAAFFFFWRIDRGGGRPRDVLGLHLALGLAMLSKGPVGIAIPLAGFVLYLLLERRLGSLRRSFPAWALALSLGPALVWLAGSAAWAPEPRAHLEEALWSNLVDRSLGRTAHREAASFYLTELPSVFVPWCALVPLVAWVGLREVFRAGGDPERRRVWHFLLAWVLGPLLLLSASGGKRVVYALPLFPGLCLLCGDAAVAFFTAPGRRRVAAWALAVAVAAALASGGVWLVLAGAGLWEYGLPAALGYGVIGVAVAYGGLLATRLRGGHPGRTVLAATLAAVLAVEALGVGLALPVYSAERSERGFVGAATELAGGGRVGMVSPNQNILTAFLYFGPGRVQHLHSVGEAHRFLREERQPVVIHERELPHLKARGPVRVVDRSPEDFYLVMPDVPRP